MDGGEPWRMPAQPQDVLAPVVLPVSAWQQTLDTLKGHPWCEVNHLMVGIHGQVEQFLKRRHTMEAEPGKEI